MRKRARGTSHSQRMIEACEPRVLLSTIYVDASVTGATHDGTSWNTAFADLQQGLAAAAAGDEIHVADGTYKPTQATDRAISFVLTHEINLKGGYGGSGAVDPNARNSVTVLSGELGISGASDNSWNVISATGPGFSVSIDGFTITQASAGAFFILDADATISNCTFTQNTSAGYGAAIYSSHGRLTVHDSRFSNNSATNHGYGGAVSGDGAMAFANCSFRENSASWAGGAISGLQLELSNCEFIDNSAEEWGGAVNTAAGIFDNCTFTRNTSSEYAGAVMSFAASFRNCAFNGNSAGLSGGAIADGYGAKFDQCAFVGNSAARSGGAIFSIIAYASPIAPILRNWGGSCPSR